MYVYFYGIQGFAFLAMDKEHPQRRRLDDRNAANGVIRPNIAAT